MAHTGSVSGNDSGDLVVVFLKANAEAGKTSGVAAVKMVRNDVIDPIFEATGEAMVNAMVEHSDDDRFEGHTVLALPHGRLKKAMVKYGRGGSRVR